MSTPAILLNSRRSGILLYYLIRIFTPVAIIVVLTWITFLLSDYGNRAQIASGNLLIFVAFNFTIAADLPRLGYLTILDSIMITTFIVTGGTVACNIWLNWIATEREIRVAERIDHILVWFYPFIYILGLLLVLWLSA